MKTLPLIAINVVTVVAALAAYDLLQAPSSAAQAPAASGDLAALDARLAALEEATGDDDLLRRINTLTTRVEQLSRRLEEGPPPGSDLDRDPESAAVDGDLSPDAPMVNSLIDGGTRAPATRVRSEGDRLEALEARNATRLDRTLTSQNITLSEDQKTKVSTSLSSFRERMRDTLGKAREQGLGADGMKAAMDTLRSDLKTELEGFLPSDTAAALVKELGTPLGARSRPGGGAGRGGSPGGGRRPRRR